MSAYYTAAMAPIGCLFPWFLLSPESQIKAGWCVLQLYFLTFGSLAVRVLGSLEKYMVFGYCIY